MVEEINESGKPSGGWYRMAKVVGLTLILGGLGVAVMCALAMCGTAHTGTTVRASPSSPACSSMHMEAMLGGAVFLWWSGTLLLLVSHWARPSTEQTTHLRTPFALCIKAFGLLVLAVGATIAGFSVMMLWSPYFAGEALAKVIVLGFGLITLVALGTGGLLLCKAANHVELKHQQRHCKSISENM